VNEKGHLDNNIIPAFGSLTWDNLTRLRIQRWVNALYDEGYAPRSVRRIYGTFKTLVLDAIDELAVPISASPFVRIRLPAIEPTGRRALTPAEIGSICHRFDQHRELAKTLAMTGCRVGELLARDVSDWSPMAGLSIPPGTSKRRGEGGPRRRGSKTPAGIRLIPICGSHRKSLQAYVGTRSTGPLFLNRDKKRVKYDAFLHRFGAAAEAAGLEDVTPHWFRHSLKTWLRDHKCDPVAVDQVLGHKTGGMDAVYVHVTPGMLADVVSAMESLWQAIHRVDPPAAAGRPAGAR